MHFCLNLKKEERKDNKNKVLKYNSHLRAHNGSCFDTWVVLNDHSCDKRIVNIIKNGKSLIELKVFNGYIEENKK